ncbi:hypothetical protein ACRCUN_06035 [Mycobacterium sp. LTG2003]
MTRTPSEHYAAADQLLADLEQVKADQFTTPYVQAKVARAQIHAALAQSPWWPELFDAPAPPTCQGDEPWTNPWTEEPVNGRKKRGPLQRIASQFIETRSATGDLL